MQPIPTAEALNERVNLHNAVIYDHLSCFMKNLHLKCIRTSQESLDNWTPQHIQ